MTSTVACANCGALNGADFGSCIRCNTKLDRTVPGVRGVPAGPANRAAKRVPAPRRRVMGGPGSEPLLGRWPADQLPAAYIMVFLNAVVFAGQLLSAFQSDPSLGTLFSGGSRLDLFRNGALPIGAHGIWLLEPWRVLSACFVHFGPLHLFMNLSALIFFARAAEPSIGSIRFIIAYTLTGIAGFAVDIGWFLLTGRESFTAGASGAVFGVMGLMLGVLLRQKDPRWRPFFMQFVAYGLVMTFLISFMIPINHAAHIGGLVAGVGLGFLFGKSAPSPSTLWQRVLASLCILGVLATLIASRLSPIVAAVAAASQ